MAQSEHEFRELKAMRLNRLNDRLFKYLFEDKPEAYHSIHRIVDVDNGKCYCGDMEFHYLELPKLKKMKKEPARLTGLERMLYYLGSIGGVDAMKEMANRDADIERILLLEEKFLADPQSWVGYLMREREKTDWEHYVRERIREATAKATEKATEKGLVKGRAEGRAEGRLETARNLLKMGMTVEQTAKATELPEEKVRKLLI